MVQCHKPSVSQKTNVTTEYIYLCRLLASLSLMPSRCRSFHRRLLARWPLSPYTFFTRTYAQAATLARIFIDLCYWISKQMTDTVFKTQHKLYDSNNAILNLSVDSVVSMMTIGVEGPRSNPKYLYILKYLKHSPHILSFIRWKTDQNDLLIVVTG